MDQVQSTFEKLSKDGFVVGEKIRQIFIDSTISRAELAQIW